MYKRAAHSFWLWFDLAAAVGCGGAGEDAASDEDVEQEQVDDAPAEIAPSAQEVLDAFGFPAPRDVAAAFATGGNARCDAGNTIYVFTSKGELLSFDPRSYQFSMLGALACPNESASPNSMAIDSKGDAWVSFHDGAIFKVSVHDLSCSATRYVTAQQGWLVLGMAFVADAAFSLSETLYLANSNALASEGAMNLGLGRMDPSSSELVRIGQYGSPLAGKACELTGLADARLFALCPGTPTTLSELRREDARVLSTVPLPLGHVSAFAFAQWGGSYFVFTSATPESNSRVDRYVPGIGMKRIVNTSSFHIVGAGVSTCAPIELE